MQQFGAKFLCRTISTNQKNRTIYHVMLLHLLLKAFFSQHILYG